jgi:hypothetical protein
MPRYDLLKKHRYVNKTTCERAGASSDTFCAEPLMNAEISLSAGHDEVINEMENCGARTISINDADFLNAGTSEGNHVH